MIDLGIFNFLEKNNLTVGTYVYVVNKIADVYKIKKYKIIDIQEKEKTILHYPKLLTKIKVYICDKDNFEFTFDDIKHYSFIYEQCYKNEIFFSKNDAIKFIKVCIDTEIKYYEKTIIEYNHKLDILRHKQNNYKKYEKFK